MAEDTSRRSSWRITLAVTRRLLLSGFWIDPSRSGDLVPDRSLLESIAVRYAIRLGGRGDVETDDALKPRFPLRSRSRFPGADRLTAASRGQWRLQHAPRIIRSAVRHERSPLIQTSRRRSRHRIANLWRSLNPMGGGGAYRSLSRDQGGSGIASSVCARKPGKRPPS